jgi:hypothetical protein
MGQEIPTNASCMISFHDESVKSAAFLSAEVACCKGFVPGVACAL